MNHFVEFAPSRVPGLALLDREISPLQLFLLLLRQVLADEGEPKKFHPLDSYAPEGFLAIQKNPVALALATTVLSPNSSMNEESLLANETKLAQFDGSMGSFSHPTPMLTLAAPLMGSLLALLHHLLLSSQVKKVLMGSLRIVIC